jgi:acyl-CoA thioesterase-2
VSPDLEELCSVLDLTPGGAGRFEAHSVKMGGLPSAFGGQLLAQIVVAADRTVPDKTVKSLHAIFVRPVELDAPMSIEVDVMHTGRLYASLTVSIVQKERLCVRGLVLLDTADVELAAHASPPPPVTHPDEAGVRSTLGVAETCVPPDGDLGAGDLGDGARPGRPEMLVWVRFAGIPPDDGLNRALMAYASEPFFFGAALRPHGSSESISSTGLVPAVITHTVTFHGPVSAAGWNLLHVTSPHVGRGRIFGHGSVFSEAGEFVASVSQENQLRPGRPRPTNEKGI